MKKFTLFLLASCVSFAAWAQLRPNIPSLKDKKHAVRPAQAFKNEDVPGLKPFNPVVATKPMEMHPSTMMTRYDMQTNSSNQNRIYYYPDGTIGVTANFRVTDNDANRGTGYNFYNGTSWGPKPTTRVEATKAGWPSYTKFGANGEIFVSHHMTDGLYILTRETKGSGTWTSNILPGPPEAVDISWPRVVTNGPDNTNIHIICVTYQPYLGMDYALLYYRSTDGGASWDINNYQIEGLTSNEYLTFSADVYTWAEPRGDTLCFTVGDSWLDQIIVKSTNNGTDWSVTKIWSNPYPKWEGTTATDWFYAPDGCSAIALDKHGKAHVTFGLQYVSGDDAGQTYWTINCDGLIYWNEDMGEITSLDPMDLEDNQYIGWVADTTVYSQPEPDYAYYYNSLSSMPTMLVDDDDKVFAFWTSVTNYRDPNNYMFRHLYGRGSLDGGMTWRDTIVDLTSDFEYQFEEAAFPNASPTCIADSLFIMFQSDPEAGAANKGATQGQSSPTDNEMRFIRAAKNDIMQVGVGIKEPAEKIRFTISQNMPNPCKGQTMISVGSMESGIIIAEVFTILGNKVVEKSVKADNRGTSRIVLDVSSLPPGTYFYKVTLNGQSLSKKMMVE
jgi:hypothetical protein